MSFVVSNGSTDGWIHLTIELRFDDKSLLGCVSSSKAAVTAPHLLCPKTKIIGVPKC